MKIFLFYKFVLFALLGGLFIGCGGGDGSCVATYSTACEGETVEPPPTGENETVITPPPPGPEGGYTAFVSYLAVENNITDPRGMFNLVADNHIEPDQLNSYLSVYKKEIIYHNVDAGKATALAALLDGNTYKNVECQYENDPPPRCQYFSRFGESLPPDVYASGIGSADIVINQSSTRECRSDSHDGVCDVTLFVSAHSAYYNIMNPIPLDMFKKAFTGSENSSSPSGYPHEDGMKSKLREIEKNATAVTNRINGFYNYLSLQEYKEVRNETIAIYTDLLTVNNGSNMSANISGSIFDLLQQPMSEIRGESERIGATLDYNGAHYELKNTFDDFASNTSNHNVDEVYDPFNSVILDVGNCKRDDTTSRPSTNATYTCDSGEGNITVRWLIQGKNTNLSW